MIDIAVRDLKKEYEVGQPVLDGLTFQVDTGERVGILGRNGAGKTTLFRILTGQEEADSGEVILSPGKRLGLISQIPVYPAGYTVEDVLRTAFDDLKAMEAELHQISDQLGSGDKDLLARYDRLQAAYEAGGGYEIETRLEKICAGLGIERAFRDKNFADLSGGEKTRINLARLILVDTEILLLDEPTNYLDADGRERLYNLIRRTSATVLVISHDRTLLNQLPAICELSSQGLTYYSGNYDFYKEQKALQQKALTQQLKEKQKALRLARKVAREVEERKAKQNVRGEKNSIKKGIPRIMMGALKNNAENSSSRLSSIHTEKTEKLQAEMSGIKSSLPQTDKLKTDFNASHLHVGKVLVKAKDVNFHYPSLAASPMETTRPEAVKELWSSSLTFQLRSGDRLSLKGKNGSGKTTLLKLIMGELHPTGGVMERADFTSVYLDQEYSLVRNERSVLQQAEAFNHRHLPEHEMKTILNRYLFPHDVWNKPCSKLSGGEKMRLSFCCLMIADNTPDMFILDEPTNNLDIESIEIITATIRDYAGTVIAISHDREFLKDTGIEREILLE